MGQEQSTSVGGSTRNKQLDDASPLSATTTSLSSSSRRKTASVCRGNVSPGMFIHQQTGNFSDRYQGLKVLGKGSFGEVILCRDKVTGSECAVKVISKKSLKKGSDPSSLLREVELLKHLDHPNIMKLFEFFEDSGYFYLVGEVYTGGELFDVIVEQKRFSEQDASRLIKQVLSGVAFMHINKIVHRDLKPENLLLESKNKNALIKIIDFGLSTHFEAKTGEKMKDKIGTAYYIAPEVLHGTYDEKCDIWSTGVILYILLSGCPPFYGTTEYDILKRVELGKFSFNLPQWRKISEAAKDLIRRMLFYIPSMRMTAQEALDHEWVRKMSAADVPLTDLPELESALSNIRQFQGTQRLAQAALLYMGSKLTTTTETKALTEIFRNLDKNGDGRLDPQELREGYEELMKMKGVDVKVMDQDTIRSEIEQVLDSADFDKNGFIEYSEFLTVAMDRRSLLSTSRLQKAFELFDVDGSGKISADELATIFELGQVDKEEWDAIMKEVDVNNDGEVDFDEFTKMLRKMCDDA